MKLKRIAIVGPESTGKTTLAKALAATWACPWVAEYAREYLSGLDRAYGPADLLAIARGQLSAEATAADTTPEWLICDTNLLVMRVWAEDKCPEILPALEPLEAYGAYAMHLLLYPDLPWKADPLREDADRLVYLFQRYQYWLETFGIPYHVIRGQHGERLDQARRLLQALAPPEG